MADIPDRRFALEEKLAKKRQEEEREREALQQEQVAEQNPPEARGRGGSTFPSKLFLENVKSPHFWAWVIGIFALLFVAWLTNFLNFRVTVSTFLYTYGFTLLGLITVLVMISFILYGWFVPPYNLAKFYIATALFIWMLDLVPEINLPIIRWLGSAYQGFEFPFWPIQRIWSIPWLPIIGSSFTFAFLYVNMVYKIIKKERTAFILSFIFILIFNYLTNQLPTYLRFNFTIPWGKFLFLLGLLILGGLALWWDKKGVPHWSYKKRAEGEIADFFTYLYMIFVFSFFWLNTGWQGNLKAWFHVFFIIAFGFGYIKPMSKIPYVWHLLIPSLLLIDFYGYGLLYSSDILALQFIPPLVIFVIVYCYEKETEKGTENYTYPVAAFILLVTFILLMSISVGGATSAEVPFIARKGVDFKEVSKQFGDKIRDIIEGRLDIATAGLYRGSVEKNRYESLGVYFSNIRAADPRFYTDEPITVWGSIQSKTYKDAVIINFSCYRWKDNKKIRADKIIPDIKFPIFTLEEVDTECTFLPKGKDSPDAIKPGSNTITFSAEYNFATDAYLKAYFMDRDRFRAYAREGLDINAIFKEFGIKDTNPVAVHTNGPVEIGMSTGQPLITVSEGYTIKPTIGITLTNRKEIQDKDKRIITKWDGKIKNITELVLLVPPGITLGTKEDLEKCYSKDANDLLRCPCSMPFKKYEIENCRSSCSINVQDPCVQACKESITKQDEMQKCADECYTTRERCIDECDRLFQPEDGSNIKYNGYELDVNSIKFRDLNKDIDKYRSFVCRFEPSKTVLDAAPITTRYFRVRARYNYFLENSVSVNVEQIPVEIIDKVPDDITKVTSEITPGTPLWFQGFSLDLISAISLVESGWRHCCAEDGKNNWHNCKKSDDTTCNSDRILTSYAPSKKGDYSIGIMQINTIHKNEVSGVCKPGQTLYDKECNIRMGIKILKENFDKHKNKIDPKLLAGYCPQNKQPARFKKYSEYEGIKAALRAYNGLGCQPEKSCEKACSNSKNPLCVQNCVDGTINYVEKILDKRNKIKDGVIVDSSGIRSVIASEDVLSQPSIEEETISSDSSQIPLPPSNANVYDTPYTRNSITISWKASPTPNVKYAILSYNKKTGEVKPYFGITSTSYVDEDVQDEVEYYYKITSYNNYGESDPLETLTVKSIDDSITYPSGGP